MASMTRRLLETYAAEEQWEVEHDDLKRCWEAEDKLANGIGLFRRIAEIDLEFQAEARGKGAEFVDAGLAEIDGLYRSWYEASKRWMEFAGEFANDGYEVKGLEEFGRMLVEAEALVEGAAYEPRLRPLDEQLGRVSPANPRPDRYND